MKEVSSERSGKAGGNPLLNVSQNRGSLLAKLAWRIATKQNR